jgi:hypothetical protein
MLALIASKGEIGAGELALDADNVDAVARLDRDRADLTLLDIEQDGLKLRHGVAAQAIAR